jgi:type I restriction enzyme, S subunit
MGGNRRFQPYPDYRDSEVEWLGKVPSHWVLRRLRHCATLSPTKGKLVGAGDQDVSFLPMEDLGVSGGIGLSNTRPMSQVRDGYTYFREGDVLVAKITPCFENGKGAVAGKLTNGIGFGTTELHVLRPRDSLDARFLAYVTYSRTFRKRGQAEMKGSAGQQRVPEDFVKDFPLAYPAADEQRAIADFLDRETARIDGLIEKKERLIELLQEKRQALITQAVTKGLDSGVKMRDSEVEWLGEIPEHWEIKRLWHLTPQGRSIMYGIVLPGPNVPNGVPIVKGGDVSADRLKLTLLNRTTPEIEARYTRSRLQTGDLVYAIRGSIGEVEVVPSELEGANLTQDAARVAYTSATCGRWLLNALRSRPVFAQLESGALGATIRGVNIRDLKRAMLPVPPFQEQRALAEHIDAVVGKLSSLEAAVERGIQKLNEYRAALISAAVTGKIDVREAVA